MANAETENYEQLTRQHGIKVPVGVECSVEECVLVVGEVVGHSSIRSASRMNGAVVLFLDKVEKVNTIVENGVVLNGSLIKVFPLMNPARKVLLSNVPPFISDEALKRELSRYGQLVSAIKKIPLGCKSPLLKHVVSFRRQVHMILRSDIDELNITFKFRVDSFDYLIFATTESMKCFGCGKVGHLVRACPERNALKVTDVESGSNEGQSVEKESEVGEVSDLSVDKEDLGSRVKSSEKQIQKNDEIMDIVFDEMEGEILKEDEEVFKVPAVKRKSNLCEMETTSKKKAQDETVIKSSEEVSNASDVSGSESERDCSEVEVEENMIKDYSGYSLERMKQFLQRTKGMRNVEVIDFFPDLSLFIDSAKILMKQKGETRLSNPEVYRLKKIVQKVRLQTMHNDMSQE